MGLEIADIYILQDQPILCSQPISTVQISKALSKSLSNHRAISSAAGGANLTLPGRATTTFSSANSALMNPGVLRGRRPVIRG